MTSIRIGGRRKSRRLGRKSRRVSRKSRRSGRKSRRLGRQSSRGGSPREEREIERVTQALGAAEAAAAVVRLEYGQAVYNDEDDDYIDELNQKLWQLDKHVAVLDDELADLLVQRAEREAFIAQVQEQSYF